jgi:hypothetical protein
VVLEVTLESSIGVIFSGIGVLFSSIRVVLVLEYCLVALE